MREFAAWSRWHAEQVERGHMLLDDPGNAWPSSLLSDETLGHHYVGHHYVLAKRFITTWSPQEPWPPQEPLAHH